MKFRLINEGISFIDVKKNKDGDFISKKSGLPVNPSLGEIFWDHDEEDMTKPLFQTNGGQKRINPDSEPDDVDSEDINPDNIQIGGGTDGDPIPLEPLLRKFVELIKERWNTIESADSSRTFSEYGTGLSYIEELEEELDFLNISGMISAAESLLEVSKKLGEYLDTNSYFNDLDIRTIYKKMHRNIEVLIKILKLIDEGPKDDDVPTDVYIDGNNIYIDSKEDPSKKIKMRRYGVHEI